MIEFTVNLESANNFESLIVLTGHDRMTDADRKIWSAAGLEP
jgi:hypothetical protein